MRKPHFRRLMVPAFVGAWVVLAYACAVNDDNPVVPRRELELGNNGLGPDGEALGDANGAPICASYGGLATAQQIALAVLALVKQDCRISATVIQSTTQNHGIQCFQAFVSASFQCDGATLAAGYKDDQGVVCSRPVDDTLSDADFDAFVQDYQTILKAKGVSDGDIAAVVPALMAQKAFVVGDNVQEGKYTTCAANCRDAGAACVRDAGPPPPKDGGPPKDAGQDSGKDATAPKDSGGGTDSSSSSSGGPKDSGTQDADADTGT